MANKPIPPIRYLSLNLGPDVGVDDILVGVRVVPVGREGDTVIGRTLNYGEPDPGDAIIVHPSEKLLFPIGNLTITLQDIERENLPESYGYAPVANMIWTWFQCGASSDEELFRFLVAAARRLDTAHNLCADALNNLGSHPGEPFMKTRARMHTALGYAELMCIALNRAIRMIKVVPSKFSISLPIPKELDAIFPALKDIRDALEHIEERVFSISGTRGLKHPDALTIFNQSDFASHGVMHYADHALDIRMDVIPALIISRQFIAEATIKKTGNQMTLNKPYEQLFK